MKASASSEVTDTVKTSIEINGYTLRRSSSTIFASLCSEDQLLKNFSPPGANSCH